MSDRDLLVELLLVMDKLCYPKDLWPESKWMSMEYEYLALNAQDFLLRIKDGDYPV